MEGNLMKMREALVRLKNTEIAFCENNVRRGVGLSAFGLEHHTRIMRELIDAALSAPPRQCDVGTPEEQFDRFAKHCIGKDCGSCEHGDGVRGRSLAHCALRWAQTPYEAQEGAGE